MAKDLFHGFYACGAFELHKVNDPKHQPEHVFGCIWAVRGSTRPQVEIHYFHVETPIRGTSMLELFPAWKIIFANQLVVRRGTVPQLPATLQQNIAKHQTAVALRKVVGNAPCPLERARDCHPCRVVRETQGSWAELGNRLISDPTPLEANTPNWDRLVCAGG